MNSLAASSRLRAVVLAAGSVAPRNLRASVKMASKVMGSFAEVGLISIFSYDTGWMPERLWP